MSLIFFSFGCDATSVLLDLFTCPFENGEDITERVNWFKYKEQPQNIPSRSFLSLLIWTLEYGYIRMFGFVYSVHIINSFLPEYIILHW